MKLNLQGKSRTQARATKRVAMQGVWRIFLTNNLTVCALFQGYNVAQWFSSTKSRAWRILFLTLLKIKILWWFDRVNLSKFLAKLYCCVETKWANKKTLCHALENNKQKVKTARSSCLLPCTWRFLVNKILQINCPLQYGYIWQVVKIWLHATAI